MIIAFNIQKKSHVKKESIMAYKPSRDENTLQEQFYYYKV